MGLSRIVLPLVLIGVVASFYYAWQDITSEPQLQKDRAGVSIPVESSPGETSVSDRFNFEQGEKLKFKAPRRNLFNQLYPAPPAPKKVVAPPVAAPPTVAVVTPPPPPPPMPVVVRRPQSRMPAFQVIGYLTKAQQLTAFVSLEGEIYLLKKDQVFADQYRVAELSQDSITITRTSGSGEVSLPLSDKPAPTALPAGRRIQQPRRQGLRSVVAPALPSMATPPLPPAHPPVNGGN